MSAAAVIFAVAVATFAFIGYTLCRAIDAALAADADDMIDEEYLTTGAYQTAIEDRLAGEL